MTIEAEDLHFKEEVDKLIEKKNGVSEEALVKSSTVITIKLSEVVTLNTKTSIIKNRGLSVSSLDNLIKFKRCLRNGFQELKDLQIAIMEKYDVDQKDGEYLIDKNEKINEINEDLKQVNSKLIQIFPIKFIPIKELQIAVANEDIDTIEYLSTYILKD
jgi:flagellar biosynthesis/type III secretory pathway chaperone